MKKHLFGLLTILAIVFFPLFQPSCIPGNPFGFVVLPGQNKLHFLLNQKDIPEKPTQFLFVLQTHETVGRQLDTKGGEIVGCNPDKLKDEYDNKYHDFLFRTSGLVPWPILNWTVVTLPSVAQITCDTWSGWLLSYFAKSFCSSSSSCTYTLDNGQIDCFKGYCSMAQKVSWGDWKYPTPKERDIRLEIRKQFSL